MINIWGSHLSGTSSDNHLKFKIIQNSNSKNHWDFNICYYLPLLTKLNH